MSNLTIIDKSGRASIAVALLLSDCGRIAPWQEAVICKLEIGHYENVRFIENQKPDVARSKDVKNHGWYRNFEKKYDHRAHS